MENKTITNHQSVEKTADNDNGSILVKTPSYSNQFKRTAEMDNNEEPMSKRAKPDRWIYSTIDDNESETQMKPDENKKDDDNQSLDEGEIVDDDDDEVCLRTSKNPDSKLPIDSDRFEEGECNDHVIKNNNDDDDKQDNTDEIASNYSDWSESEDDLLKADTQQETKTDSIDKEIIPIKSKSIEKF